MLFDDMLRKERSDGKMEGKMEGKLEGKRDSALMILSEKSMMTPEIEEMIRAESDSSRLDELLKAASKAEDVDSFISMVSCF